MLHVDGQQIAMRNTISASGALYVSNDNERGYSCHSKGGNGVLSWQPAGEPEQSVIVIVQLLKRCWLKSPVTCKTPLGFVERNR